MIEANSNFNALLAQDSQDWVWIAEIQGISTLKICSNTFSGITTDYYKIGTDLTITPLMFDEFSCRTQFGGFVLKAVNLNDAVTSLVGYDLIGKDLTVKVGFQSLTESDFVTFPIAQIIDFNITNNGLTFELRAKNEILKAKPIFRNLARTTLSNGFPATAQEHLSNGDFSSNIFWGFSGAAAWNATYTNVIVFATGSPDAGTIYQYKSDFAQNLKPNTRYILRYSISNVIGSPTASLTVGIASSATALSISSGSQATSFTTNSDPGNMTISITLANSGDQFWIDNLSIKEDIEVIGVASTADFQTAQTPSWDTEGTVGTHRKTLLKIDSEFVEYTAKTSTTFTLGTRGAFGNASEDHSEGATIKEILHFYNYTTESLDLVMGILTSTGTGLNGDWDNGVSDYGMGLSISLFDVNQIKNEWQKWISNKIGYTVNWLREQYIFDIDDGLDDGLDFLESMIFKSLGLKFILTSNHKIGVLFFDVHVENSGLWDITQDDIIYLSESQKVDYKQFTDRLVETIKVGNYNKKRMIRNVTTDVVYGEQKPYGIELNDLYFLTADETYLMNKIVTRFGNPPLKINAKLSSKKMLHQTGDVINLTYPTLLWPLNGTKGFENDGCEITNIIHKFSGSKLDVIAELTSYLGYRHAGTWSGEVIVEDDIYETDLTENSDHAAGTLQPGDAVADISPTWTNVDRVMYRFELQQPNESLGSDSEYIEVYLKIQNPSGTDVKEIYKKIYYDETSSKKLYADMYVLNLGGATVIRVRADWVGTSGTYPPTTVKLVQIKQIKLLATYSTTDYFD